jgi:Tol biopolymer transport system component
VTLASGSRLGPYEILSPLGAGGMGEVYRARDAKLQRDVAVKVLPERVASDPEALARFEREARAVAAISHPNILAIHDFGKEGSVTYAVTELLEGETLRAALSGGPLPVRKATDYAVQIARGLAAAHEKGIVHRDVKPDNVFVTRDGRVKILDFGLARPTAAPAAKDDTHSPTVTSHTEPGAVLGTVGYMSPEQVKGQPIDGRSDIFSFGAVLYEMLAGRRAFQGGSQAETMAAILQRDPPELTESDSAMAPALERIMRRCLEKKPEQRFQSASDLAFALESPSAPSMAMAAGGTVTAKRSPVAGRLLWAILGGVLSGAVVFLALGPGRRSRAAAPAPQVRFTIAPPPGAMLQGMLAISPDGGRIAFVATGAEGRDLLYVRALDALEVRPLEGTDGAAFPFWSPDSRSIAFFAQGKLKRVDASGGAVQTLCAAVQPRGGSWGTAGTIVFSVGTGGEVDRVSEGGGNATALPGLNAKGVSYRWPAFLPDGHHFLLCEMTDTVSVFVGSLDSAKTARLLAADGGAVYAAPGFLIYRGGDRLMAQRFDAERLRLSGEAFPVIEHVWWDGSATGGTAMSVSDNGFLACQTGGAVLSRLLWYDRSGRELGGVGPDGAYWEPTLSPDDKWLAIPRMDPEKVAADLWVFDLERGGLSRLASRASVPTTPLWSADAQRVVYSNFTTGEVFVHDARGLEGEKALFRQPGFTPLDDWSRDGHLLFYEVIDFAKYHVDVWVRDLQSGTSHPVLQAVFNQQGARLSPDGRWLAYESDESGTPEIYVRSFPGAGERRQISKGGGQQARWRRDGKELFYVSQDRKVVSVEIRPGPTLDAGVPRPLFQTRIRPQIESRNHYDVTSDGQRFIVNSYRPEDAALPITVVMPWAPADSKK